MNIDALITQGTPMIADDNRLRDQANKQRTFDAIVKAMFAQGKPAVTDRGACCYLAPDGSKCAAGVLIPEARYDKQLEYKGTLPVNRMLADILTQEGYDLTVVQALQRCHDNATSTARNGGQTIDSTEWLRDFGKKAQGVAWALDLSTHALWDEASMKGIKL